MLILSLLFGIQFSNSQTNNDNLGEKQSIVNTSNVVQNKIYNDSEVDIKPSFPGGFNSSMEFLLKNYPELNNEMKEGKITLSFIVEVDGTIANIRSSKNNLKKAMAESPNWSPAKIKDQPVRCRHTITFLMEMQ